MKYVEIMKYEICRKYEIYKKMLLKIFVGKWKNGELLKNIGNKKSR